MGASRSDNHATACGRSLAHPPRFVPAVCSAGKSTAISMLCGNLEPTGGSAEVMGLPLENMDAIHRVLGICPQFDCVFDTLSVQEHLRFCASVAVVQRL